MWLDISKYQARRINLLTGNWDPANWDPSRLDWDKIAAEAEGIIIRVGDGLNLDPCFERYRVQAIARGMRWGIYHLHRPTVNPSQQVAFIHEHQRELPPAGVWADLESSDGTGGQAYFDRTNPYLLGLDAVYGALTGIYSGAWFLDPLLPPAIQRVWSTRKGWWASYPGLSVPQGWAEAEHPYVLHQWTDAYPWKGLPKPADASRPNPVLSLADILPGPPPVPSGDRGTRIGIHAIQPQATVPLLEYLRDRGGKVASLLAVEQAGLLMDAKRISPGTTRILRLYTPQWDGLDGIGSWDLPRIESTALEIINYVSDRWNRLSDAERAAVDLIAILNEADPPTPEGWYQYGILCIRLAWWATADGVRLLLPGWNNGTPEYGEMVLFFSTGLAEALVAGRHGLNIHEGVHPPGSRGRIALGTIPGAPFPVEGAGPLALRYRHTVDHLRRTGQVVPDLYVGEFYGGSYAPEDAAGTLANFQFYDAEVRKDPWLRAFHGFTMDGGGGWDQQNYNPLMTSTPMAGYIIGERDRPNTQIAPRLPDVIAGGTMAQYLVTVNDTVSLGVLRARIGAVDVLDLRVVIPAGNQPEPPRWFELWPTGVLNPARLLKAPGTALTFYRRDGSPMVPQPLLDAAGQPRVVTWQMSASEHIVVGGRDLLRVVDRAGDADDWYVRALDVQPV